MRVLSRSLRRTRALALAPLGLGLLLCALGTGEARAQEPAPTDPIAAAAAASDAPKVVVAPDDSPVVRAAPNNWAMTFAFGGLGSLTANGIVDQKAGNLLFTEIGFRAVLSSVTIPFSVGLGLANTSSLKGPSTSSTDVGLSFTGGVLKSFRVWRRIAPYFGGLFHFSYLDPSGDNNWIIGLSIGPVLGIEYYIADRVSLLAQGTFQFGVSLTDPQAAIGLGSAISGGGQLGLVFYF
ncbi:MAG TPA: hypothetical protein PLW65_28025 [Pseudomonadota bacterium]|nr:hypothetical protein [Pseudomonadota bacterium]